MQKSSKVIEELIRQESITQSNYNNTNDSNKLAENKSDLSFSQGYSKFALPKYVTKLNKQAVITNCTFSRDDPKFIVCSLNSLTEPQSEKESLQKKPTLFVVWNINDSSSPYRVLHCEAVSNCLSYFSFIVISGNVKLYS
jgi:hypothetical protein